MWNKILHVRFSQPPIANSLHLRSGALIKKMAAFSPESVYDFFFPNQITVNSM